MRNTRLHNVALHNARYRSSRPSSAILVTVPTPDVTVAFDVALGFAVAVDVPVPDVALAIAVNKLFDVAVTVPTPSVAVEFDVFRAGPIAEEHDMSARTIKAGSTSQIIAVPMRASNGAMQASLAYGDVTVTYTRDGQAASAVSVSTSAGTAGTWSDGGWVAQGGQDGMYQLGIPNAAIAAGAAGVTVVVTASGCLPTVIPIELVAYNPQDSVRMGMTALPAYSPGIENGLPVLNSDVKVPAAASGVTLHSDYDAAKTAASATALAAAVTKIDTIDTVVDAIRATDVPALDDAIDAVGTTATAIAAAISALNDPTVAAIVAGILAEEVQTGLTIDDILKRLNAYAAGDIERSGTDPIVVTYFAEDGSTEVMDHNVAADASARTVTFP